MSDRWPISPSAVALDLLDADERALADQLMVHDPAFAAAVVEQAHLAGTLDAMPAPMRRPVPPPPLHPADAPKGRRSRWSWTRPKVALPIAAALAAAVIAVVIVSGNSGVPTAPVEQASATLVLKPLQPGPGKAKLTVAGSRAEIVGSQLPPTPEGKHYEAWLARADGSMTPMGGFRVGEDGNVNVGMDFYEDLSKYDYVDVSVEPDDVPPQHSGTSILRARL